MNGTSAGKSARKGWLSGFTLIELRVVIIHSNEQAGAEGMREARLRIFGVCALFGQDTIPGYLP